MYLPITSLSCVDNRDRTLPHLLTAIPRGKTGGKEPLAHLLNKIIGMLRTDGKKLTQPVDVPGHAAPAAGGLQRAVLPCAVARK